MRNMYIYVGIYLCFKVGMLCTYTQVEKVRKIIIKIMFMFGGIYIRFVMFKRRVPLYLVRLRYVQNAEFGNPPPTDHNTRRRRLNVNPNQND